MGHPAHFHLFKHVIAELRGQGHESDILIKKKDVLEDLLQSTDWEYHNILPEGRGDSKTGLAIGMVKRDWRMLRLVRRLRPDILIGTSVEISHVGKLLGIPSVNVNEDDWDVVPMYAKLAYPWASSILAPVGCRMGKWESKTEFYRGYHELAYLHPDRFTPDMSVVEPYFNADSPYAVLRFSSLNAHHDEGIRGITDNLAAQILERLEPHMDVWITSERELTPHFEKLRMPVKPQDIHHVLAFAQMYIGDSQTMAAEAGVLGTPFLRYNDFVGRISYLDDIENHYRLGFGIPGSQPGLLLRRLEELLGMEDRSRIWQERRERMLGDKVDVTTWMVDYLIEFLSSRERKN
jgi:predicted glycosyltransferase